jgi:hypothetical protein
MFGAWSLSDREVCKGGWSMRPVPDFTEVTSFLYSEYRDRGNVEACPVRFGELVGRGACGIDYVS